jgi:hypothetical protein
MDVELPLLLGLFDEWGPGGGEPGCDIADTGHG